MTSPNYIANSKKHVLISLRRKARAYSFARRKKLYQARTRLLAHNDFTEQEYDAAVLRADARARALAGQAPL
jgi:hypothetical protein